MPPTRQLHRPHEPAPLSTTAAADLRARLVDLRDRLDLALQKAAPAYVAALARQLQAVLTQLATLPDPDAPADMVDQLRARGAARLAAAGLPEPPRRTRRGHQG